MFRNFELIPDDELAKYKSDYVRTSIAIEGLYGWGTGYYSSSHREFFENAVYDAFYNKGYEIIESNSSGHCAHLAKKGSNLDIYMHPMEFSGTATPEEIEDIIGILSSFEQLKVNENRRDVLYDIPDSTYRFMIFDRAEEIVREYAYSREKGVDAAFDFAKNAGIERLQHFHLGYSSSDLDITAAAQIIDRYKELKKENPKADIGKTAKKIGAEAKLWSRETEEAKSVLYNAVEVLPSKQLKELFPSYVQHTPKKEQYLRRIHDMSYKEALSYYDKLKGDEYDVKFTVEGRNAVWTSDGKEVAEKKFNDTCAKGIGDIRNIRMLDVHQDTQFSDRYYVRFRGDCEVNGVFADVPSSAPSEALKMLDKRGAESLSVISSKCVRTGEYDKKAVLIPYRPDEVTINEDGSFNINGISGITADMLGEKELVCRINEQGEVTASSDKTGTVVMNNPAYGKCLSELVYLEKEQKAINEVTKDDKSIER